MPALDKATYLRLSAALKDRAERYADDHDMSFAAVVRQALAQFLDQQRPPSPRPPADYVSYGDRKPYTVADNLNDLCGPIGGVVTLDRRLNWSGTPTYDLDDPGRLASMYVTVLSEAGTADQLRTWLNHDQLVKLWPTLNLPHRVRNLWNDRFPELAATRTSGVA